LSEDILGEKSGKEQGDVADVLADLAFPEERARLRQRVGLRQNLAYLFQAPPARVADAVEPVYVSKIDQKIRDILGDLAVPWQLLGHQLPKQPAQRVIGADR
jgi:hypothetical protein